MLNSFIKDCHSLLIKKENDEITNVIDYLQVRGIEDSSIIDNNIGYCPLDYKIPDSVKHYGKENDPRRLEVNYSYFINGRLIVPIYDEFDVCAGIATRKPSFETGETWWNLPIPFYKGRHLFLLNRSKKYIFEENKVYIVEGYMDALYLYQKGIRNIVAIMGTAFTLRKIALIARYCDNVCFAFDVDLNNAGQDATNKSICLLHSLSLCDTISVIDGITEGLDPDDYVKENGVELFLDHEKELTTEDIKNICIKVKESDVRKKEHARKNFCKE